MKNQSKKIFTWFGVKRDKLTFSNFLKFVESKKVEKVKIQEGYIEGLFLDGGEFIVFCPSYTDIIPTLRENGVIIDIQPASKMRWFLEIIGMGIILGAIMVLLTYGNSAGFGFGRSKATLMSDKGPKVLFKDVAGIDEAKEELAEIVNFLRDSSKLKSLGGRIPKGCLLIGPPGTGKTLLAKATAGEANVPFFSISGSDFVEEFAGVGASRVRDMFAQAKKYAPCIIFIDEIDAVGRSRGMGEGAHEEREQTLNQILVEMDGFKSNEGIIIIAATNRPDVLDPALLRPGRFDRKIMVTNPDIAGREQILKVHINKIKHSEEIDLKIIARGTPGFSGAELANLINESALLAARENKKLVSMEDLEKAKDKVLMGVERKSMIMSDEEKKITAYHEAGHAIVSLHVKSKDPIHKVTIIPFNGREFFALGGVVRLPESDRYSLRKDKIESDIAVAMGGRVAEQLIFVEDKITAGASNDIKTATRYARAMVVEFGMSDKIGPISYSQSGGEGGERSTLPFANSTLELIDREIKNFVDSGYNLAYDILNDNMDQLHALAKELFEKESLTGKEIHDLLDSIKPKEDTKGKDSSNEKQLSQ